MEGMKLKTFVVLVVLLAAQFYGYSEEEGQPPGSEDIGQTPPPPGLFRRGDIADIKQVKVFEFGEIGSSKDKNSRKEPELKKFELNGIGNMMVTQIFKYDEREFKNYIRLYPHLKMNQEEEEDVHAKEEMLEEDEWRAGHI
ncbi:hypothetical protein QJS04_geneDACA023259 [Acorus gramineus]|uniref:Uncharacterized protein n=1 Tax=Acorus gramineus TaxID=55184 RepID=A0AAV9A5P3_ACOGR|nr:hypothetical protein QJS04_geneDACA023259 [Acorus gramineus]